MGPDNDRKSAYCSKHPKTQAALCTCLLLCLCVALCRTAGESQHRGTLPQILERCVPQVQVVHYKLKAVMVVEEEATCPMTLTTG